jgi:DNA-directed RNA polymerase subunit RPC12/RpoP
MPKYKCLNTECPVYLKDVMQSSTTTIKEGELIDSAIKCPKCGSNRKLIEAEGMTTYMLGSPNVCKK